MKMSKILLFLSFLTPSLYFAQMTEVQAINFAQTASEKDLIVKNTEMLESEYYYQSEILADKLLSLKPESPNYNYRKGFASLYVRNEYKKAIKCLEIAVKDVTKNWDAISINEKSAPIDAIYYLAVAYHRNQEIDKAIEQYNKFINNSIKSSSLIADAKMNIIQCNNAKSLIASPVEAKVKNIGSIINTDKPEYSPVIALDGSALYFTSRREWADSSTHPFLDPRLNQFPEDVYVSHLDDEGNWTKPERLPFCHNSTNEACCAVSTDERTIYIYKDSSGYGDIYKTDFHTNKFNEIIKLDFNNINTEYWESHASMSHDGTLMFITSNRPGGKGRRDIYMLKRNSDGSWTEPQNLSVINTDRDEDAPFVSVDNKRLYYATNGPSSMGGFDIMYSDMDENGNWGPGKNIGYPINSTNDDGFYTTTTDGLMGFITSEREDGYGEKDIYEIQNEFLGVKNLAVLKGKIKTTDGSPIPEDLAVNVKLICTNCDESQKTKQIFPRLKDGVFMTGLTPCKTYKLVYVNIKDNRELYTDGFETKCDSNYQEIHKELMLDPKTGDLTPVEETQEVETVVAKEYKNLEFMHYFAYNKNKMSLTKDGELKDFVTEIEKQLNDGREKITINIYSSASTVPTKTYETNEKLTQLRAENMKYDLTNYFNQKYNGKVNVVIVSAIVDGPEYDKDAKNQEKYHPYQFVGLKTE